MTLNQAKGALFGLAIGDALGATTEFRKPEEIRRFLGWLSELRGGGWLHLRPGEATDDTAMTLAVARGVIRQPEDPIETIGEEFLRWKETKPKDIGNTCRLVLNSYSGDWFEAAKWADGQSGGISAGNGSLMRCLPAAIAYPNLDEMTRWTRLQSKMTHYDSLADEACVIYNRIASHVLRGDDLRSAMQEEVAGTRYEGDLTGRPDCDPDGFVVHTLQWVLYLLSSFSSYSEVVEHAANEGFDSDTVGAIAGGLKGLQVGFDALPAKFVDKLVDKSALHAAAEGLWAVRADRIGRME